MWRKKFFRFLKEKGVFQLYIDNINEQHPGWDYIFWDLNFKAIFSEEKKCAEAITYAFCWRRTKQGYEYWRKLSNKWNCKNGNYFYKI